MSKVGKTFGNLDDEEKEDDQTEELDKRKTITIYGDEHKLWVKMKEKGQTWTGLLKMVRKGYEDYKILIVNQAYVSIPVESVVANQAYVPIQHREPNEPPIIRLKRPPSANKKNELKVSSHPTQPSKELLDEVKKAFKDKNFLKRLTDILMEFWGHCSNLQVWSDYDYDTALLDKSLAFPLLRKLKEVGDPRASKSSFKEEIAERFEQGIDGTRMFLINQGYLRNFSMDEFETLFRSVGNRYEDDTFWVEMKFKELFEAFENSDDKSATFIYCNTHQRIANVTGRLDSNRLYLNCGCELTSCNEIEKYDVSIIKVFKK